MSDLQILERLKWKKLKFTLNANREKHEYHIPTSFAVNSIVKFISTSLDGFHTEKVFFHIPNRIYYYTPKKNSQIFVEVFFVNENLPFADEWKEKLLIYFDNPENCKNYSFKEVLEINEESLINLQPNESISDLSDTEVTLNFLTPLHFKPYQKRSRIYIDSVKFFQLLKSRIERLFNISLSDINTDLFSVLPYYWKYTEVKRHSKSQEGSTHFINGCIGHLYIRGDLRELFPYLLLGSALHTGTKMAYSYGYYQLNLKSLPSLTPLLYNLDFYKRVFHQFEEEFDDFDESDLLQDDLYKKIFADFVNETYENDSVTVFNIKKSDGGLREIHKPSVKDLFAHKVLVKIIEKPLDNSFEEESIGYRKGYGRHKAVEEINKAIAEGYNYVIESDIEDFFPSVEHSLLIDILKKHIPKADYKIVNLIEKCIKTKVPQGNSIKISEKGLSLGSPLSPILANLYLDYFDELMKLDEIKLIRYADDFVILLKDKKRAEEVLLNTKQALLLLNLHLNEEKTAIKPISDGFTFLGFEFTGDGLAVEKTVVENQYKKPLFVTEPFSFLGVRNNRVEVKKGKEILLSVPIKRVSEILLLEKCTISSYLIKRCSDMKIPISITLNSGYYINTIKPDTRKYYDTLVEHTNRYFNLSYAELLEYAKALVFNKVSNYNKMLSFKREYDDEIKSAYHMFLHKLKNVNTIDEVRGLEGFMAKKYYKKLNSMILNPDFKFKKRERFGNDRMNPLLNYGYYLLFTRINSLVRATGLNPFLGFLHSPENDYESLVADIQELFRAFVDRFLVRIINLKSITADDFNLVEGRYYLKPEARKKFLSMYEAELVKKGGINEHTIMDVLNKQVKDILLWVKNGGALHFFRW